MTKQLELPVTQHADEATILVYGVHFTPNTYASTIAMFASPARIVAADLARLSSRSVSRAELLAECADGAEHPEAWQRYVDALERHIELQAQQEALSRAQLEVDGGAE